MNQKIKSLVNIHTLATLIEYEFHIILNQEKGLIRNHANKIKNSCHQIHAIVGSNGIRALPEQIDYTEELYNVVDFILTLDKEQLHDFFNGVKKLKS